MDRIPIIKRKRFYKILHGKINLQFKIEVPRDIFTNAYVLRNIKIITSFWGICFSNGEAIFNI